MGVKVAVRTAHWLTRRALRANIVMMTCVEKEVVVKRLQWLSEELIRKLEGTTTKYPVSKVKKGEGEDRQDRRRWRAV
jgi:hypothetical protein